MKKIITLLALLLALAAVIFWYQRRPHRLAPTYYANYLPEDTLATVSLFHLKELSQAFPRTALGHLLCRTTMSQIFSELKVDSQIKASYDQLADAMGTILRSPAFRTIFGDDTTVALLPDASRSTSLQTTLDHSLVLFATSSLSGALDRLGSLFMGKQVSHQHINGIDLVRIDTENDRIFAHRDGQVILLAHRPEVIGRCLAAHEKPRPLAATARFQAAVDSWKSASTDRCLGQAFINIPGVRALLERIDNRQAKDTGQALAGVTYLAATLQHTGRTLVFSSTAGYQEEHLAPPVRAMLADATTNNTLNLLALPHLAYSWNSGLLLDSGRGSTTRASSPLHRYIRRYLGLTPQELDNSIGPQYGGMLLDMTSNSLFPLPRLLCFLQLKNNRDGRAFKEKLITALQQNGLGTGQQHHLGKQTITTWSLLPGEATQLAITERGNMLYLANGASTLEKMLQLPTDSSLPKPMRQEISAAMVGPLSQANSDSLLLWPAKLSDRSHEFLNWASDMAAAAWQVSFVTLKKEIHRLMRSIRLLTLTTTVSHEQGQMELMIQPAATAPRTTAHPDQQ